MTEPEDLKVNVEGKGGRTRPAVKLQDLFKEDDMPVYLGEDRDFTIRYDSADDEFRIRDEDNAQDLSGLSKNTPHEWEQIIPVIFETAQTGLAADSTGVKFTSQNIIPTTAMLRYLTGVAVEATFTASQTDSVTAVEIYDEDAPGVIAPVSGNTGTDTTTGYSAITAGNSLVVRVNVTTASATTGATTDVDKAVIYLKFSLV